MNHQFKPGDLAIVIRANKSENLGKVLELIRYDDSEVIDHAPDGPFRTLNPDRRPSFVVRGSFLTEDLFGRAETTEVAAIPIAWLMPLRGDFQPERKQSREVPA